MHFSHFVLSFSFFIQSTFILILFAFLVLSFLCFQPPDYLFDTAKIRLQQLEKTVTRIEEKIKSYLNNLRGLTTSAEDLVLLFQSSIQLKDPTSTTTFTGASSKDSHPFFDVLSYLCHKQQILSREGLAYAARHVETTLLSKINEVNRCFDSIHQRWLQRDLLYSEKESLEKQLLFLNQQYQALVPSSSSVSTISSSSASIKKLKDIEEKKCSVEKEFFLKKHQFDSLNSSLTREMQQWWEGRGDLITVLTLEFLSCQRYFVYCYGSAIQTIVEQQEHDIQKSNIFVPSWEDEIRDWCETKGKRPMTFTYNNSSHDYDVVPSLMIRSKAFQQQQPWPLPQQTRSPPPLPSSPPQPSPTALLSSSSPPLPPPSSAASSASTSPPSRNTHSDRSSSSLSRNALPSPAPVAVPVLPSSRPSGPPPLPTSKPLPSTAAHVTNLSPPEMAGSSSLKASPNDSLPSPASFHPRDLYRSSDQVYLPLSSLCQEVESLQADAESKLTEAEEISDYDNDHSSADLATLALSSSTKLAPAPVLASPKPLDKSSILHFSEIHKLLRDEETESVEDSSGIHENSISASTSSVNVLSKTANDNSQGRFSAPDVVDLSSSDEDD